MSILDSCKGQTRTHRQCHKHSSKEITFICAQQECLEPLCQNCVINHTNQHQSYGSSPSIVQLNKVEDFYEGHVDREIKGIMESRDEYHTPSEEIQKYIDAFFYGSQTGRETQLKKIRDKIKAGYDVHALIRLFQEGHQYKLAPISKKNTLGSWMTFFKRSAISDDPILSIFLPFRLGLRFVSQFMDLFRKWRLFKMLLLAQRFARLFEH